MSDDPRFYLIPADMLTGIIAYLGRRPYAEVAQAMRALESLQLAPGSAPDPEPELSLSPQPEDMS